MVKDVTIFVFFGDKTAPKCTFRLVSVLVKYETVFPLAKFAAKIKVILPVRVSRAVLALAISGILHK